MLPIFTGVKIMKVYLVQVTINDHIEFQTIKASKKKVKKLVNKFINKRFPYDSPRVSWNEYDQPWRDKLKGEFFGWGTIFHTVDSEEVIRPDVDIDIFRFDIQSYKKSEEQILEDGFLNAVEHNKQQLINRLKVHLPGWDDSVLERALNETDIALMLPIDVGMKFVIHSRHHLDFPTNKVVLVGSSVMYKLVGLAERLTIPLSICHAWLMWKEGADV
jgi:hypothetical protein